MATDLSLDKLFTATSWNRRQIRGWMSSTEISNSKYDGIRSSMVVVQIAQALIVPVGTHWYDNDEEAR